MTIDRLGRTGSHNGGGSIGTGAAPNGVSSRVLALAVVFGACVGFDSCLELQEVDSAMLGVVEGVGLETTIA